MPDTVLEKVTAAVDAVLQTDCEVGVIVSTGVGFTVIVKVDVVGDAGHPLAVAVTV